MKGERWVSTQVTDQRGTRTVWSLNPEYVPAWVDVPIFCPVCGEKKVRENADDKHVEHKMKQCTHCQALFMYWRLDMEE